MKILIAPDSFKESLSAIKVADAIEKGFRGVFEDDLDVIKLPVADGGEGTVEAMVSATGGRMLSYRVTGPLGTPIDAFYGILGGGEIAVIEMAAAAGLDLLKPEERNPLITTSRGLGELILAAVDHGARHIIVGLGGSATNDAGAGMLQALGVRLIDQQGNDVSDGGGSLADVVSIDINQMDSRLADVAIDVACDVDNPLTGEKGATYVFGPQKGADCEMLEHLESCLVHFGSLLEKATGRKVCSVPGSGAAGGLGAACVGVLNAKLKSGIEIVLEALSMAHHLEGCDLVVTGEGRMDGQSVYGKAPVGVAGLAKQQGIPVIALIGSLGEGYEAVYDAGIDAVFSVVPGVVSLPQAMQDAEQNISRAAFNVARTLQFDLKKST